MEVARTRVLALGRSAGCGLQELDLNRSVGGPAQLRVAGQERQVELSGELDEQRVVHPEHLPGREFGRALKAVGSGRVDGHPDVVDDANRRGELLQREPTGQKPFFRRTPATSTLAKSTVSAVADLSMSLCCSPRACSKPSWSMNQRRNTPVSTT